MNNMIFDNISFTTQVIPIINSDGKQVDEVVLGEPIKPVPRRRCGLSEKGVYYKGAGIIYTGHFVNELDSKLKLIENTGIPYEKYHVVNPSLFRKFGIFTFQHQPFFSDWEGGCGKKEANMLYMHKVFQYSAIDEIVDVVHINKDHCIYSYILKELKGSYKDTLNLIEYIMCSNFNTAWDKNSWDDISCYGYVRDLADWFISDEFSHKLGTIYSLLNALYDKDRYTYETVVRTLTGYEQLGKHHIILISALIVNRFSPKSVSIDLNLPCELLYSNLWELLFAGKSCCHLENEEQWEYIKNELKTQIPSKVSSAVNDYHYHLFMVNRTKKSNGA